MIDFNHVFSNTNETILRLRNYIIFFQLQLILPKPNHMKTKPSLFSILCILCMILNSCNKTDFRTTEAKQETAKTLTEPSSQNKKLTKIYSKLIELNNANPFLEEMLKRVGVPKWDNALFTKQNFATKTSSLEELVIIPLVETVDSSRIGGFFACSLSTDSININLYQSDKYADFGFSQNSTDISADDIAKLCIYLEYRVLDKRHFDVLDNRLFAKTNTLTNEEKDVYLIPSGDPVEPSSVVFSVEHQHCTKTGECASGVCDRCNLCIDVEVFVIKENNFSDLPVGGGNNWIGGTGGGSTGMECKPCYSSNSVNNKTQCYSETGRLLLL
jgi:hypothetical protein